MIFLDPPGIIPVPVRGEVILEYFGMNPSNFGFDVGILFAMAISSLTIAGVLLTFFVKEKR